jgi:hypothetical protein
MLSDKPIFREANLKFVLSILTFISFAYYLPIPFMNKIIETKNMLNEEQGLILFSYRVDRTDFCHKVMWLNM